MAQDTRVQRLKMVLDASFLNTQHYKVCIKSKVEQSREMSSILPKNLVVAIEKGAFGLPLTNYQQHIYFKMNRSTKRFVFFKNYLFCSYICVCFQLVAFIREHMWHKVMWIRHSMTWTKKKKKKKNTNPLVDLFILKYLLFLSLDLQ